MGIRLGGRQKGTPNKVTKDVKELARAIFDKDYWAARRQSIREGKCPPQIEGKLLAYAYGEPKQEHTLNTGITVNIGFINSGDSRSLPAIDVTAQRISEQPLEMIGPAHVPPGDSEAG